MKTAVDNYELIAKRCPTCESLVQVKVEDVSKGEHRYLQDYKCSQCDWTSPAGKTEK